MKKISKAILVSIPLLFASNFAKANMADVFPLGAGSYWEFCWKNVTATEFKGDAEKDMISIKVTHHEKYNIPIIEQSAKSTEEFITVYTNSIDAISSAMNMSYNALREMQTTMQKSLMREKLNYLGQMTQDGINEQHFGFFKDHNGGDGFIDSSAQSFSYFQNMCRRNKMFSEAFRPEYRIGKSLRLSSIVNDQKEHTLSANSSGTISTVKTRVNYENFCSVDDVEKGICDNNKIQKCDSENGVCLDGKEIVANGMVRADSFLSPNGDKEKNAIPDEMFKTDSTYSEEEEEAARAFALNVVYSNSIPAPTMGEKGSADKAKFVALYNQYIASLDLASYSFNNAVEERSVVSDGELQLSKRDIIKYIHTNLKNPDNIATATAGKDKAMETYIFTAQSLKNKIDYDRVEQNERIQNLLSAILVKMANNSENIELTEYLNR